MDWKRVIKEVCVGAGRTSKMNYLVWNAVVIKRCVQPWSAV